MARSINRLLLPIYRDEEMEHEIEEEWKFDSRGKTEMGYVLFQKYLFRVAHYWCTVCLSIPKISLEP